MGPFTNDVQHLESGAVLHLIQFFLTEEHRGPEDPHF